MNDHHSSSAVSSTSHFPGPAQVGQDLTSVQVQKVLRKPNALLALLSIGGHSD